MAKCSCGIASANVFKSFDRLENELKKENPDFISARDLTDDIRFAWFPDMKKDCKIDLSEEKKLLDEAIKHIFDKRWDDAIHKVRIADFQTWNKLLKCAEKKGD